MARVRVRTRVPVNTGGRHGACEMDTDCGIRALRDTLLQSGALRIELDTGSDTNMLFGSPVDTATGDRPVRSVAHGNGSSTRVFTYHTAARFDPQRGEFTVCLGDAPHLWRDVVGTSPPGACEGGRGGGSAARATGGACNCSCVIESVVIDGAAIRWAANETDVSICGAERAGWQQRSAPLNSFLGQVQFSPIITLKDESAALGGVASLGTMMHGGVAYARPECLLREAWNDLSDRHHRMCPPQMAPVFDAPPSESVLPFRPVLLRLPARTDAHLASAHPCVIATPPPAVGGAAIQAAVSLAVASAAASSSSSGAGAQRILAFRLPWTIHRALLCLAHMSPTTAVSDQVCDLNAEIASAVSRRTHDAGYARMHDADASSDVGSDSDDTSASDGDAKDPGGVGADRRTRVEDAALDQLLRHNRVDGATDHVYGLPWDMLRLCASLYAYHVRTPICPDGDRTAQVNMAGIHATSGAKWVGAVVAATATKDASVAHDIRKACDAAGSTNTALQSLSPSERVAQVYSAIDSAVRTIVTGADALVRALYPVWEPRRPRTVWLHWCMNPADRAFAAHLYEDMRTSANAAYRRSVLPNAARPIQLEDTGTRVSRCLEPEIVATVRITVRFVHASAREYVCLCAPK